jgi:hypothetical protein
MCCAFLFCRTWQYWRDDVRPKSQFNKKFISRFSKGVKAQQAAKALVRSGIPYDHRGTWLASSTVRVLHLA